MVRPGLVNWLLITEGLVDAPIDFTGTRNQAMGMIMPGRRLEDNPVHGPAHPGRAADHPERADRVGAARRAGPVRQFFSITLPLIMPAMLIAALLRALDAFRIFDLPYVLTGAGRRAPPR